MEIINCIIEKFFDRLNKEGIEYCLLRNYQSIENINEADDLDVSISNRCQDRAKCILYEMGWMTPDINLNLFGHEQFFKWDGTKLYKLDIIWGFFFSNGEYELRNSDFAYKNCGYISNIKIPEENFGIRLLVLHIVLDKGFVSSENKRQLEYLMRKANYSQDYEIGKIILESKGNTIDSVKLKEKIINQNILDKKHCHLFKICFNLKRVKCKCEKKSYKIAIIGIDGTGKSTSINQIKKYYGNKVETQYFGFRDYKTRFAKKQTQECKRKIQIISPIMTLLSLYMEMLYRYISVIKKRAPLNVFDRYVWEAGDNTPNMAAKILYKLFFKVLFPRVDGVIYLYCPLDTSLNRKDDIDNIEKFTEMKQRYDYNYLQKKKVLAIDTSTKCTSDVLGEVISYVFKLSHGRII
jgi:thymidylate kinase